jgi:hypothetical protein
VRVGSILVALALIVLPSGAVAQAPSGVVMPYAEYRQGLLDGIEAIAGDDSAGTPTTEVLLERLDAQEARIGELMEWNAGIVPDPCYAAAHARYSEYYAWLVPAFESIRPMIEDAATIFDVLPAFLALDAEARSRFPDAYVADPTVQSGFRSSPINILDSLATCEGAVTPAPAPTPVTTVTITKEPGGDIEYPRAVLPPGDYEVVWETTCNSVGLSYQGVQLFNTGDDGKAGTTTITIEPPQGLMMVGGGGFSSCEDAATLTVTITLKG